MFTFSGLRSGLLIYFYILLENQSFQLLSFLLHASDASIHSDAIYSAFTFAIIYTQSVRTVLRLCSANCMEQSKRVQFTIVVSICPTELNVFYFYEKAKW